MSDSGMLSVGEVNDLDLDQFIWLFGNVIEKTSDAANYTFNLKPFTSAIHIVKLFNEYLDTLSTEGKEKILLLHPDLGAKEKLTEESTQEQEHAGMTKLSSEDQELLMENNYKYREKFGFPFVLCARENTSDSILEALQKRLENDKSIELTTGIDEIKKITKHRVFNLVWHD